MFPKLRRLFLSAIFNYSAKFYCQLAYDVVYRQQMKITREIGDRTGSTGPVQDRLEESGGKSALRSQTLHQAFGAVFDAYRSRTWALIPGLI